MLLRSCGLIAKLRLLVFFALICHILAVLCSNVFEETETVINDLELVVDLAGPAG